jgi:adenylate cyclase
VHLLAGDGFAWVVVLDCSLESRARQALQQRGNDLTLLRTVHGRILDQLLGHHDGADLGSGPVALRESGERRVVTALVADLRGSTRLAETAAPDAVIRALDLHLRTMVTALVSEGAMIDEISGDGVQAIFGLLPSTTSSEDLAIRAAHRLLADVGRIHLNGRATERPFPGVGIGIATGPAVIGLVGSRERRTFTAVGYHVNLAALLEREAGPGEILVDGRTRAAATDAGLVFTERLLSLPRLGGEVTTYRVTRRAG